MSRFDELVAAGGSPLLVPFTATFTPGAIPADRVLTEYARFYLRLYDGLINSLERRSKRHRLPFAVAWRDDPRTRRGTYRRRPSYFNDHPDVAPHVHGLMLVHPPLVERFHSIAGDLEPAWRSVPYCQADSFAAALHRFERPARQPIYVNRTFHLDRELGDRLSSGLYKGGASARTGARTEMTRWLSYSAKMTRRWDAGNADAYIVLPTAPKKTYASFDYCVT